MESCLTCGADWSQGRFSESCPECGGGALEIACPVCSGKCGAVWMRAVMDSNDSGMGHFVGACRLADVT
ncbi:MAG: hypothetical protein EXR70_09100 [Deltaproteobacteria bacterium]|nr:hypothetical protein [Deltaproteobacteria bacterium]